MANGQPFNPNYTQMLIFLIVLTASAIAQEPVEQVPELSPKAVLESHGPQIHFSPDGRVLAMWLWNPQSGLQRGLHLWDTQTGREIIRVADGIINLKFSPDSKFFVTCSGKRVSVWDVAAAKEIADLEPSQAQGVRFLRNGETLVTQWFQDKTLFASAPTELAFWDTKSWSRMETGVDKYHRLYCPLLSPDGTTLAAHVETQNKDRGDSWEFKIWNVRTGNELPAPKSLGPSPFGDGWIGFTPDGKSLIICGLSKATFQPERMIWDLANQRLDPVPNWQGNLGGSDDAPVITFGQMSPYDGLSDLAPFGWQTAKAIQFADPNWIVWDVRTQTKLAQFADTTGWRKPTRGRPGAVSVINDEIVVVPIESSVQESLGARPTTFVLLALNDGKTLATLRDVETLATDTHGKRLAFTETGRPDWVILFDIRAGRKLAKMQHDDVQYVRFSPNGNLLVTSGDKFAKLWDLSEIPEN